MSKKLDKSGSYTDFFSYSVFQNLTIVFALIFGTIAPARAVVIPNTSSPWLQTQTQDDAFASLLSRHMTSGGQLSIDTNQKRNDLSRGLVDLANKGDLRARLIFFGQFGREGIHDDLVLETFEYADRVSDPKLLYEIAKIMQLRLSLCLNVIEESGKKRVERRCTQSYDNATSARLYEAFANRYISYFVRAAQAGYAPAQFEAALLLLQRPSPIPGNEQGSQVMLGQNTATAWLELAADSHPEAKKLLSQLNNETHLKQQQAKTEQRQQIEHERLKPECEYIHFTGIVSAGDSSLIEKVLTSPNIDDTLARNPIRCDRMGCTGAAYLHNHPGQIVGWNEKVLRVATPIDFNTGRRDIFVSVRRSDMVCD